MGLSHKDMAKAYDLGHKEGRRDGELAGMKWLVSELLMQGFDERKVTSTYNLAITKWKRNQHSTKPNSSKEG